MCYAVNSYAGEIVIKCGYVLLGWPENVPFTNLSDIGGGSTTLLELRRRWNLPEGHAQRLRFEPASPEDRANAARDPESVHPTPKKLPELKERAARSSARAKKAAVRSYNYHPETMRFLGRQSTSTRPEPKGVRSQRIDTGRRRPREADNDPRVTKKKRMVGITSMECVIPGFRGTISGSGGGAEEEECEEDCAVDDPITEFELSSDYGGHLSDEDEIESASGFDSEAR